MRKILLLGLLSTTVAAPGGATTLREALTQAYQTSPAISNARARLRSSDEDAPIARAQGLPSISALGNYTENVRRSTNDQTLPDRLVNATLRGTVPIYAGGSIRNSIRAADARVVVGRQSLRSTENQVFVDTVTAYMDVIRDSATVDLYRSNLKLLSTTVDYARSGFKAGDLTRTDIAQASARREIARGQLASALAQLDASREVYLQVVGQADDDLQAPGALPPIPATADQAVSIAFDRNPDLAATLAARQATRYGVRVASATVAPRISVTAEAGYSNYFDTLGGSFTPLYRQTDRTASVGVQAVIPLFQGGQPAARVRKAQADDSAALEQITLAERAIVAQTRASYWRYGGANRVVAASRQAIQANEQALAGVRAESRVGSRTVIEVLNAQQELLNARVQLAAAERDAYVAAYQLLASMGTLDPGAVTAPGTEVYDPTVNGKRVRRIYIDFDRDPTPRPVAPTTRNVPMNSRLLAEPATPDN